MHTGLLGAPSFFLPFLSGFNITAVTAAPVREAQCPLLLACKLSAWSPVEWVLGILPYALELGHLAIKHLE